MKTTKQILAVLLALLMLVTTVPFALADDSIEIGGQCGENVFWKLDDQGKLTIFGEGEMALYKSGFDEDGNYYHTDFDYWKNCRNQIKTVDIQEGVTSIAPDAFSECRQVTSISISKTVVSIGDYAFISCVSLVDIFVDEENTSFVCDEDGVLFTKDKKELLYYPLGKETESYVIPDGVEKIATFAFADTKLKEIVIPDSVLEIGQGAFTSCEQLTQVRLPNQLKEISNSMFRYCHALSDVEIPESVETIEWAAFEGCDIETVVISKNVTEIAGGAFSGDGFKGFIVDEENTVYFSDEDGALFNKNQTTLIQCPSAIEKTTYVIPDSVTTIGNDAFWCCRNLTEIIIPDNVTFIGDSAFAATSITTIHLPQTLQVLSQSLFYACSNLEYIEIPESVSTIENDAFFTCIGLREISISKNVEWIGHDAFSCCNSLERIQVDEDNSYFYSDENGVLYDKDKTLLIQYPIGSSNTEFSVPDGVETIRSSSFRSFFNLNTIRIPHSVKTIGWGAFDGYSDLTVYYAGSAEDWDLIEIDDYNNALLNAEFHFCEHENTTEYPAVEGSCSVPGYTAGVRCDDCGTWVSGHEKVIVPHTDADQNGVCDVCGQFIIEPETLQDDDTGVEIAYLPEAFDTDVSLNVETLDPQNENARAWEIKPVDEEGNLVQPNQPVQIRLPLPAGWNKLPLLVTHTHDDGEIEIIRNYQIEGDYITFWVSRFSEFAVSVKEHEHTYDDGVVTTPATCTEPGVMTYTCVDGDDSYTEEIPALGHIDEDNNGLCDRCEQQMEGGDHCPKCGKIHNGGFFDKLTGFFHKIIYRLTHLFQR